jgi:hypothetical protein
MATTPDLSKATDFLWRTARLLERRRFAYLFLDGEQQAVLEALRPYQNPDGGFGNGLEPDVRGPVSQPVPTWTALCILDEAGAFADPIVTRAQRAHYRLTWAERFARNARLPTAQPLIITIHGLPDTFALIYGFALAVA